MGFEDLGVVLADNWGYHPYYVYPWIVITKIEAK